MNRRLIIVSLSLLLFIAAAYTAVKIITRAPYLETPKLVRIPAKSTASEIALLLEERGIIKDSEWFLYWTDRYGLQNKIQAGVYEFSGRTDLKDVIKRVSTGDIALVSVTIPEGYTNREMALLFEDNGLACADEFFQYVQGAQLEGFLFPDTYLVPHDVSIGAIVNSMSRRFRNVFTELYGEEITEDNIAEVQEIVTMASIVEKESMFLDEKRMIADILYRRLDMGMLLQSCATVLYAMGTPKARLLYSDLRIDSPFNTYRYKGLPPTPICNPGRHSLEAAIRPTPNEYLFFLAGENGRNHFSRTYREHNLAMNRFLNNNGQPAEEFDFSDIN